MFPVEMHVVYSRTILEMMKLITMNLWMFPMLSCGREFHRGPTECWFWVRGYVPYYGEFLIENCPFVLEDCGDCY